MTAGADGSTASDRNEPTRREFLRTASTFAGASLVAPFIPSCSGEEVSTPGDAAPLDALPGLDLDASTYGHWRPVDGGLAEFVYTADHEGLPAAEWDRLFGILPSTRRHWHLVGNRALQVEIANDGKVGLFDESEGLRWLLFAGDDGGSGLSRIHDGGSGWGSAYEDRPTGDPPERAFGPTWFTVTAQHLGLRLARTLLVPEGERPWVLVRVALTLDAATSSRRITHREVWRPRARFLDLVTSRDAVSDAVRYDATLRSRRVEALEIFPEGDARMFGSPARLMLEALGDGRTTLAADADRRPTLTATTEVALEPGETRVLWFRFGRADEHSIEDPAALYDSTLAALAERLPSAIATRAPEAALEIPWHVAALTGGSSIDRVLGGDSSGSSSTRSAEGRVTTSAFSTRTGTISRSTRAVRPSGR